MELDTTPENPKSGASSPGVPPSPTGRTDDRISLEGDFTTVRSLRIDDPLVANLLSRHQVGERAEVFSRMVSIGARGMVSMGLGLELADVDRRVRMTVADALEEGRRHMGQSLTELQQAVTGSLDPDHRASVVGRCLTELEAFRAGLADSIDPRNSDSNAAALLHEMNAMLGPGGILDQRLRTALDPETDGSALAGALRRLEQRLDALHVAVAEGRGRESEALRGTAKGFEYEDRVEERLRRWARGRGATVERTSTVNGERGLDLAGDFVVLMPGGARIVVETKNSSSISLNGGGGILVELRRALDNRRAEAAVCLSRQAAFPAEVGPLGIYGDLVLAVDDPEDADDTMLTVALAIAVQRAEQARDTVSTIDPATITERLERIRSLATQLSSSKRSLTDIGGAVEKVKLSLEAIRIDMLETAADIQLAVRHGDEAEVIDLAG